MPSPVFALTGCSAWKSPSRAAAFICCAMCPGFSRSTLFRAITTGTPSPKTRCAMKRSPAPMRSRAERTRSTASTSSKAVSTVCCIRSVSASSGRWKPGRSTSTSWWSSPLAMPKIRRRVVCGLSETIATLPPQSAFTSVDFPTFGVPATATKPLFIATAGTRCAAKLDGSWGTGQPPYPHPRVGVSPLTLYGERSSESRTSLCRLRANSSPVEVPCFGEQLGWRTRHDLACIVPKHDAIETELPQPLPATAARRCGDPDRLEVAWLAALGDRARDCSSLRADSEWIRGVLDVDALEHAPVSCAHGCADEVLRIRRVRARRCRDRQLVQLIAHANTWNRTSVIKAPSKPP